MNKVCGNYFLQSLLGTAAICLILTGCQSMQKDPLLSSIGGEAYRDLLELEETIVRLDGAGANHQELGRAWQQAADMKGASTNPEFQAQLAAWSGRLYLMEGKNSDAGRENQVSQTLSPHNVPSQVLSFRLERNLPLRLSMIDQSLETEKTSQTSSTHSVSNGKSDFHGEILVERGRVLFDLGRFSESVAAFDTAFALLGAKPFYEEAYGVFRNKARELIELQQGTVNRTMDIAKQREITWKDLIEITRNETELLKFITAGRNWPVEALFTQLLDRAFIPYTQDTEKTEWPFSKPSSAEIVLRSGAAWFLWHLYAENHGDRGLLTGYSSRFANTPNAQSPVGDLGLFSPYLDSILGCVESEFITLPDSRNFFPAQKVTGYEFLAMLKKL